MMNNIELKPCPFCGEKPITTVKAVCEKGTDYIRFKVHCYKCRAEQYVDILSGSSNFKEVEKAKQEVAEVWNRRVGNG